VPSTGTEYSDYHNCELGSSLSADAQGSFSTSEWLLAIRFCPVRSRQTEDCVRNPLCRSQSAAHRCSNCPASIAIAALSF